MLKQVITFMKSVIKNLVMITSMLRILNKIFFSIYICVDIPLVPSLSSTDPEREPNFVLHWLNNKEMHFSLQAEAILNVHYFINYY